VLLLGLVVALICGGYSVMGFTTDLSKAFIPRLLGLIGIDSFLIVELAFLFWELKRSRGVCMFVIGFFIIYILFDLIIFGSPSALTYIRYEFHTSYENSNKNTHIFHYIFITIMMLFLFFNGVQWFKSQKIRREKAFVLEIILSNFVLIFAAIPDTLNLDFSRKYPTFGYSLAAAFVFFSYFFSVKSHIKFTPTIKNVSKEVFNSVDVPVIIFDTEGKINLYNPCAKFTLQIVDEQMPSIRSIFTLSDVETMRFLTRVKNGWSGLIKTKIRASKIDCNLACTIKNDNMNETFCVIGTVLPDEFHQKSSAD
jgi:hypothetical protein